MIRWRGGKGKPSSKADIDAASGRLYVGVGIRSRGRVTGGA